METRTRWAFAVSICCGAIDYEAQQFQVEGDLVDGVFVPTETHEEVFNTSADTLGLLIAKTRAELEDQERLACSALRHEGIEYPDQAIALLSGIRLHQDALNRFAVHAAV